MQLPPLFRMLVMLPLAAVLSAGPCHAAAPGPETKDAMRVLRDQCVSCHKAGKAKGGLLLTTREKMLTGGDTGPAVVPGKAADSLVYQLALQEGDPHMPPKKQLAAGEMEALKAWIESGAPWDASVFDEPPVPRPVKLTALPATYQPVLALAFSPDEKRLALARGSAVILVDMTKPEMPVVGRLEGHTEPVQSLAWSRDGKWLVTGGFQRIIVWDAATSQQVRTLSDSLVGNVTALVLDATSQALFAADGETGSAGFVRKFSLQGDKPQATWKAHDDTIYGLRLSPSGDRLLSGSADKLARLWDTGTLKLVATYEGHTNHVVSVAFNKDATQIATAGADREVKVWDVKSREQDVTLGDKKTAFTGVAWTPDGQSLAVAMENGAGSVYTQLKKHTGAQSSDSAKEVKLNRVEDTLTSIGITNDGKLVYAGDFSGKVHIWDALTGKYKSTLELK